MGKSIDCKFTEKYPQLYKLLQKYKKNQKKPTINVLHLGAWQVESTIPHLADLHFFMQIHSAVLKADSLPN